jgi:hypothetical protein
VTFTLNQNGSKEVEGQVRRIRVDSPPGIVFNPHAIPTCELSKVGTPECAPSIIGLAAGAVETSKGTDTTFKEVPIYNVVPPAGAPSDFAYPTLSGPVQLVGGVSWHAESLKGSGVKTPTGDSHELFTIEGVPQSPPLVSLTIAFFGAPEEVFKFGQPNNAFVRIPTSCTGPATNYLEIESYAGESKGFSFTPVPPFTPVPLETVNCKAVPFSPTFNLTPETSQSDSPTGLEATIGVPQDQEPSKLASSHLRTVVVTLPEGMTLSPSAAQGLEGCTKEQVEITPAKPTNTCPAKSVIGTATVETPAVLAPKGLPAEHEGVLSGNIYLGKPASGPITGPPYTIYVTGETGEYGVGLVQEGKVEPNLATGRLTTTFAENPQSPFSTFGMRFNGGALAPLANPLACGTATTTATLAGWAGNPASTFSPAFAVDNNGKGGSCASPLSFALTQATENSPSGGGQASNFTLHLKRADGQQYLSSVSAALPPGLVGKIPAVPLCLEPAASTGACPATSQIGKIATVVGSGPTPVSFTGNVYLTGPTGKGPYGMTMVVNAAIGPFSLGNVVARAAIEINVFTGRVTVTGNVPTIWAGIPLRLKELVVAVNRQGFLINPTNCGLLATESALGAQQGGSQNVSTPFQVTGCSSLVFKPSFGATAGAKTSRTNGVSLVTKLNFHPKGLEANVKSVKVSLPKSLPSRTSTLNKACREVVFNANPFNCPSGARVGSARVKTPVLPGQMSGPAYFVSHGGAKFPDIDLVLEGNGVRIILVGNTNINEKTNVTTTTFAANPDVPFTGFELNLPSGPKSALAGVGNLCRQSLVMPTTITGQNGKVIKQNTSIAVTGCPVLVLSRFSHAGRAIVTVRAPSAGRVSGSGTNLHTVYKHPNKAKKVTLEIPLSKGVGHSAVRVRIGFIPKSKKEKSSVAHTTVVF